MPMPVLPAIAILPVILLSTAVCREGQDKGDENNQDDHRQPFVMVNGDAVQVAAAGQPYEPLFESTKKAL